MRKKINFYGDLTLAVDRLYKKDICAHSQLEN